MTKAPRFSLEFFPPASLDASFRLWDTVRALAPYGPQFASVTYGAGGTTQQLTQETAQVLQGGYGIEVAAHLTCVGASRQDSLQLAEAYHQAGLRRLVALRGDAPQGTRGFAARADGFADSVALVAALARRGGFDIAVGAYPERHPDAADDAADVRWLKRKADAGAHRAITQFFFEAETFLRFRDACVAAGIGIPLIPGILPVHTWEGAQRFALRCGARVPPRLAEGFDRARRDGRQGLFALAHCASLCDRLRREGVDDFHFYTLNRPQLVQEVLSALGVTRQVPLEKVA